MTYWWYLIQKIGFDFACTFPYWGNMLVLSGPSVLLLSYHKMVSVSSLLNTIITAENVVKRARSNFGVKHLYCIFVNCHAFLINCLFPPAYLQSTHANQGQNQNSRSDVGSQNWCFGSPNLCPPYLSFMLIS